MSAEEFWELSPREFSRELAAHTKRREDAEDRVLELAWYTAAFQRAERLPDLKTLMQRGKPQAPVDMKARVRGAISSVKEGTSDAQ